MRRTHAGLFEFVNNRLHTSLDKKEGLILSITFMIAIDRDQGLMAKTRSVVTG